VNRARLQGGLHEAPNVKLTIGFNDWQMGQQTVCMCCLVYTHMHMLDVTARVDGHVIAWLKACLYGLSLVAGHLYTNV
jgi:hypothetical protein